MGIALSAAAIVLVVLVALVAIPIDVAFNIDRVDRVRGQVNFHWFFGLVRFRMGIPGAAKPQKPKAEAVPAKKTGERGRQKPGAANIVAVIRQSAFRRRVYRFIRDLLRAAHSRDLYLRMRIGLGDPADTGRLWAVLGPVAAMATGIPGTEVRIQPEFMDPVFEFHGHGRLRLIPLQFLALAIAFALSPPSLRAWRSLRRSKA